jgi:MFS family permease
MTAADTTTEPTTGPTTEPTIEPTADGPTTAEQSATGVLHTWRETPRTVKALLAGVVVNRLGAFIQVFLVLFLTNRGFSTTQAGFALGVYGAGTVAGVLLGGELTDRLGARRTILISMTGTAGLVLGVLYLHQYLVLLVAIAVVGAISQAYRPASSTLVAELTPKPRLTMTFAMYRLAFNIGSTAAPLIGAALIAVSYSLLFWGEAIAALGYAVIALVALPGRKSRPTEASGKAEHTPAVDRTSYVAVLADRRFMLFLVAMLINSSVYVQYLSTLPVAMRSAGLNTVWYGVMVALNGLIVITCELLVTRFTQRWPTRIVVLVGFVLLGSGMAVYSVPLGVGVFLTGTVVWSLAEIIGGPTMFSYPPTAAPEGLRGRYIGAASAMFGLGSAIGPIVGLALWDRIGTSVWWVLALAELVGLTAAWFGIQPSALKSAPDRDAESAAGRSARAWARDRWERVGRPPRVLAVVDRLIIDRAEVWRQVATRHGLRELVGQLLTVSTTSLAVYGAVVGAGGGFAQALSSAIKLPLLFLATLVICLPALYLFSRLLGVPLSLMQAAAAAMVAITIAALSALALAPVSLFFLVTVHSYPFTKVLNVAVLILASAVGLSLLTAGVVTLSASQPPTAPQSSVVEPADSATSIVRTPPVKVLLYCWVALFGLVGTQLGWTLRPFFGASGQPFSVFRQIDGTFFGDVLAAVARLFGA